MTPLRAVRAAAARPLLATVGIGTAVVLVLAFALGWHVSDRIHREALLASYDRTPPRYDDVVVVAADSATIALRPLHDERRRAFREGAWSLVGTGGSGRVGAILRRDGGAVVRAFAPTGGRTVPGDSANLRTEVYQGDPLRARGIGFTEVAVRTELGPAPAWSVRGERATWFLFVHGKGAGRSQFLRLLPLVHSFGFPALIISYRNDGEAPESPDGRYHYGLTEWKDVEAAARYAIEEGAEDFFVMGTSMGGGIVAAFLRESPLASRVRGAVLDAPMLDFGETIDWGVRHATIPGTTLPMPAVAGTWGKWEASWRFGVDWKALDLRGVAASTELPLLILHGDEDQVVPIATSREIARRAPGRVSLVEFSGADHAEGWNVDSLRYTSAVRAFLESRGGAKGAVSPGRMP